MSNQARNRGHDRPMGDPLVLAVREVIWDYEGRAHFGNAGDAAVAIVGLCARSLLGGADLNQHLSGGEREEEEVGQ